MSFNPDQPRYKTCCLRPCCNVKQCSIAIATLECIGFGGFMVNSITDLSKDRYMTGGSITMFIFGLVAVSLLFVGIFREKSALLIPHMVYQACVMLAFMAFTLKSALAAVEFDANMDTAREKFGYYLDKTQSEWESLRNFSIAITLAFLVALIMEAWFLCTIVQCYHFILEKSRMTITCAPIQLVPTGQNTYIVPNGLPTMYHQMTTTTVYSGQQPQMSDQCAYPIQGGYPIQGTKAYPMQPGGPSMNMPPNERPPVYPGL